MGKADTASLRGLGFFSLLLTRGISWLVDWVACVPRCYFLAFDNLIVQIFKSSCGHVLAVL